jgi:hypothetical protein
VVIDLKKSGFPCEGYVGDYFSNSAFRETIRSSVHIKKLNVKRFFARKETTSEVERRCTLVVVTVQSALASYLEPGLLPMESTRRSFVGS